MHRLLKQLEHFYQRNAICVSKIVLCKYSKMTEELDQTCPPTAHKQKMGHCQPGGEWSSDSSSPQLLSHPGHQAAPHPAAPAEVMWSMVSTTL